MIKRTTTIKSLIISSVLLGIIIGAGSIKALSENNINSLNDVSEYLTGLKKHGKFVREFNFIKRAHANGSKPWNKIVDTREFQILSEAEKDGFRNKYFSNSIEPGIPCSESLSGQIEFFLYAEAIEKEIKENGFFEKKLPLPRSSTLSRRSKKDYVAPLHIKTRNDGYNYYIKISTINSNMAVETLFIRSGESIETKVPLGSYIIKYATGKDWYGQEHLFGPDTSYSKAEKTFAFTRENGRTSGYTVELFRQINGNLRTKNISKNSW